MHKRLLAYLVVFCSFFVKLETSIAVKDATGDSDEDESLELRNYFPDFLWLLHDVTLIPPGEDGKEISPTDYLKTKVFRHSRSFMESESDQIFRAILTVFPSIAYKTIQQPSIDPTVMRNIASRQNSLDQQFSQQVEELVQYLLETAQGKKGFVAGTVADGPLLATLATHYLEAVNNPDAIPCISDTWQTAITMRCKKVMEQLLEEYDQEMEGKIVEQGLPMEEDSQDDDEPTRPFTLFALHRSTLLQKTTALLKQVGHFLAAYAPSHDSSSALNKNSLCAELEIGAAVFTEESTEQDINGELVRKKKATGGILFKYAQRNHSESHSSCNKLLARLYGSVEEKMKQADKSYTFDNLLKDLEVLREEYCRQAVGPAKWEVYNAFIKAQDAIPQESVLTLQTQKKNDAQMNHQRLQELEEHHKEEMERFQKDDEGARYTQDVQSAQGTQGCPWCPW